MLKIVSVTDSDTCKAQAQNRNKTKCIFINLFFLEEDCGKSAEDYPG